MDKGREEKWIFCKATPVHALLRGNKGKRNFYLKKKCSLIRNYKKIHLIAKTNVSNKNKLIYILQD